MPTVTIYQMNGRKDTIRLRQGSISHADAERISDGHMKYSKSGGELLDVALRHVYGRWFQVAKLPLWGNLVGHINILTGQHTHV